MKKTVLFLSLCAAAVMSMTACGAGNMVGDAVSNAGNAMSQMIEDVTSTADNAITTPDEQNPANSAEVGSTMGEAYEGDTAPNRKDNKDMTAEDARAALESGNRTYLQSGAQAESLRADLAENGQHPYAVVVTCSDSRVSPEVLFQTDLGDVFVIRTAGNVVDAFAVGSVEYAVEHLETPLVIVMGHSNCGAVSAAVEGGEAPGDIAAIVEEIAPSVTQAQNEETGEKAVLDKAIALNVEHTLSQLRDSEVLSHLEEQGKVKMLGAVYNIHTGEVSFLDSAESA